MNLVMAAGGTSVYIYPKRSVHGLCVYHLLANLRLVQLASMGSWVQAGRGSVLVPNRGSANLDV